MQWIKRNLVVVVGGVVALGLLAFAAFYLMAKIQHNAVVSEELEKATKRLQSLAERNPHPGTDQIDNIGEAMREAQRLVAFRNEVALHFEAPPHPTELDNRQFRTLLDNTISELRSKAKQESVEIPTNYWFTFEAQKGAMTFSPASLQPLASQLADIRAICEVLFEAKVNRLLSVKRASVDREENTLGSHDYLSTKATTNEWTVIAPYEVTIQGFTSELASVLEGLVRLPHCVIVTNLVVQPASSASSFDEGMPGGFGGAYGLPMAPGLDPMTSRYGGGSSRGGRGGRGGGAMDRYQLPTPIPVPMQPAGPRAPQNVVDEQILQYTLYLQIVKLKPQPVTKLAQHAVP
jgi:hypothetical protein